MAFGTQDEPDEVMNEINMTPLVDVMLVLLIIFIITVPVMKHAVNIDLPRATSEPEQPKPENILFSVTAEGDYYWNDQKIADSELPGRLAAEAAKEPQPELHIRGDKAVRYERVAKAMSEAREAGVRKIGFITEPDAK
ncbi:biopolymer transporter ExbD [Variovorax paradoxus]|jgi:biopolymer transport protein ExbD|uniref:ExbD/TolR family protein n=1 Tax=Variovorax TaxID=34072 RepID=UPI0006E6E979|nr:MULTISPECIES: biopolymer transporter ExbD [unclassified Variovorax]KPU90831.1 biopolymer transporter ExbD [Variovorax paradoxus]KPU96697.1 biopolymer transporter ExbD [Variovorax paradoxus]KPV04028.1 biopolymer transporter ExbD [Variovorax paradoxus]KPV22598.1 biopolymer transporter ExbD [Variovorax paradoxus]KPV35331.1 biopolymer transporter ExbD [Variovorax paradoxus]